MLLHKNSSTERFSIPLLPYGFVLFRSYWVCHPAYLACHPVSATLTLFEIVAQVLPTIYTKGNPQL